MSILVVINPVAGGRSVPAGDRVDLARRVTVECGERADVFVTEGRGHAGEMASAALRQGTRLVIAWGGDGTINEIASVLASTSSSLGIVPSGSGNGFARVLKVPRDPELALRSAVRAVPRVIDMGEMGGRPFVNLAGVGFDAYVAARFDEPANVGRGLTGYARIAVRALASYVPLRYTIRSSGNALKQEQDVRAVLVTAANGTQYGNDACIAPGACLDDGLLNLVIVQERSRVRTVAQIPRLFTGSIERSPDCTILPITEAEIACEEPMTFHVDGEPVRGGTSLAVRIRPGVLSMCV